MDLDSDKFAAPNEHSQQRETTRRNLAFGVGVLIAFVVLVSGLATWITPCRAGIIKEWTNQVYPPLIGIAGAIFGFFFAGKER